VRHVKKNVLYAELFLLAGSDMCQSASITTFVIASPAATSAERAEYLPGTPQRIEPLLSGR